MSGVEDSGGRGVQRAQQAKLTASDAAAFDYFGWSVAISGDTAVVGALLDDHVAADAGSAYVFTRSGTTWTQQAKLIASDAAAFDHFGFSVAILGDTAVVGPTSTTTSPATPARPTFLYPTSHRPRPPSTRHWRLLFSPLPVGYSRERQPMIGRGWRRSW